MVRALLSKALIQLPANGWGFSLFLLIVWPEATQPWGLLGHVVGLMVSSKRIYTQGHLPGLLPPVTTSRRWDPAWPSALQETLQHYPVDLVQSPGGRGWVGVVAAPVPWVCVCARFCLCPPRVKSLVLPVLWKPYNKSCWPSRSDSLGIPSPFAGVPGWKPDVGLRTFTTVGQLLWYYCSPVCGLPISGYGIWFYHDCTASNVLLQFLLWLWV